MEGPGGVDACNLDETCQAIVGRFASDDSARFSVLLAAIVGVLHRYYGGGVSLQTPCLASAASVDPILPMSFHIDDGADIKALLTAVAQVVEQSYNLQAYPVGEILSAEGLETNSILVCCPQLHQIPETTDFDLTISFDLETWRCDIGFNGTVGGSFGRTLQKDLQCLLAEFETLDTRLDEINLIDADVERKLAEWNDTSCEIAVDLVKMFEQRVEQSPDGTALVFEGQTWSYAELNRQSNQLSHTLLQALGDKEKAGVIVMLERSVEAIVSILAVLKSGCHFIPVDPENRQRLGYIVRHTNAAVMITVTDYMFEVEDFSGYLFLVDAQLSVLDTPDDNPGITNHPTDLAYILYTSGSSGEPKGCQIEHRNVRNYLGWALSTYCPKQHESGGNFALFSSLAFDFSLTPLFCALLSGRTLTIHGQAEPLDKVLVSLFSEDSGTDSVKITPAHIKLLQALDASPGKLRLIIAGGEALTHDQLVTLSKWAPDAIVVNEYGPTETTVGCIAKPISLSDPLDSLVRIGTPIANTTIQIVNPKGEPCFAGVMGEIAISGHGVFRGYLKDEAQTESRTRTFPDGTRAYLSGDLGMWTEDGELLCFGRNDEQIKIRGYRVEPGEIENLLRGHEEITDALVIPCSPDNSETMTLAAYVITSSMPPEDELKGLLLSSLPAYMVPQFFVPVEQWPLTVNGKLDRDALPDPMAEQTETTDIRPIKEAHSEVEAVLVSIWRETLGIEILSVDADFFKLGGDSIKGIQIVAKAEQKGILFSLKDLFRETTIENLASIAKHEDPDVSLNEFSGQVPLSPMQAWFFELNSPEPHHFNQSVILQAPGNVSVAHLETSLVYLFKKHDALRANFSFVDGAWQQFVKPWPQHVGVEIVDLTAVPEEHQSGMMAKRIAEAQAQLSLGSGELMNFTLFRLTASSRLLITAHHLIVDAMSWRLLLMDLCHVYEQLSAGQATDTLATGNKSQISAWYPSLHALAAAEVLAGQLERWRDSLNGESLPLSSEGYGTLGQLTDYSVELSEDLSHQLISQAGEAYNTQIDDLLLTALVLAGYRSLGLVELTVDLEGHGRVDLSQHLESVIDPDTVVGWLASVFPIRFRASDDVGALIKTVKEQLRDVPDEGIGYGLLRFLGSDQTMRTSLKDTGGGRILFNYLGEFDLPLSGEWQLLDEVIPNERSASTPNAYPLVINAMNTSNRLRFDFSYNADVLDSQAVEQLAETYLEALKEVAVHCLAQIQSGQNFTPSDFPALDMGQSALDDFLADLD